MTQIVTVTDADGVQHWTAEGSAAHQRLTRPADPKEASDASDDARQGDGDNPATGDSGPGDGEKGDTRPARRRGQSPAEPSAGGELQPGQ